MVFLAGGNFQDNKPHPGTKFVVEEHSHHHFHHRGPRGRLAYLKINWLLSVPDLSLLSTHYSLGCLVCKGRNSLSLPLS